MRNGYPPQWDSYDDQRSIILGAYHAKKRNYRNLKMKYILLSIFLVLLVLFWYTRRTSLEDRFNKLKRADYSIFNDIEIVHRKGLYYKHINQLPILKVNRGVFITESLSIEYAYSDNKALELTEYDKEKLKKVICAFL